MARVWTIVEKHLAITFCGLLCSISCVQYEPVNQMPHSTDFLISPSKPTSEDAIRIDWLCPITDPNLWDHLDVRIQWFQNGCEVDIENPEVFPAWRTKEMILSMWRFVHGTDRFILYWLPKALSYQNSPPRVHVTFFPQDPRAGEEIFVDWWASDADGDNLEISWNWLYNDTVVPIQEENFPKDVTQRGDQIGIRFLIYDEIDTVKEDFLVDVD